MQSVADPLTDQIAQHVARALPTQLDEATLAELAARLAPYLAARDVPNSALLTAAEAAARANVHVDTIRRAVRSGDLRVAGKVGRSLRITAVAIDDWIGAGASPGDPPSRPVRRRPRPIAQSTVYSLREALK
jgi:excisionase family DNA binding protein